MNFPMRLARGLRIHRKKEDGTVSVEFVLWMPLFMVILALAIDASLLFMSQSNYWSVSRDTARLVARHAMDGPTAKAYAEMRAGSFFGQPQATVEYGASTVTVTLSAPAQSILLFDGMGFARGMDINARITQALEPI